jgi:type IV pilus assembly protein PilY1
MFKQTIDTVLGSRSARSVIHAVSAGLCSLLLAPAVWSASLSISDSPLFLTSGVNPNVFFELDDSGSMDWEILTKKYWSYCDYDMYSQIQPYTAADKTCHGSKRGDGLWLSHRGGGTETFEYIYVNGDASYSQSCNSSRETLYACNSDLSLNTPYQNDWRILSSDFNVLYYDNRQTYRPWQGPCLTNGTQCADASFTSARSNPRQGTAGYTLTRDLDHFTWELWVDTRGYSDWRPYRGNENNATSTGNGEVDLWDTHITYEIDGTDIDITVTSYAPDTTGLHPSTVSTTLTGSGCHPELASSTASCRTIDEVKQNAANWYQYARKRQYVAKAGLSAVVSQVPGFRYGLDTINQTANFIEVPTGLGNYSTHNDSLLDELFGFTWPAQGTPLRTGLKRVGDYYSNTLSGHTGTIPTTGNPTPANPSAIEYSCQKNFTVLMTDGYWSTGSSNNPGVGNVDNDSHSNTVADVARKYYITDLSTLANDVPPDTFDPKVEQHMVTYTLAFGVEGLLVDTDPAGTGGATFGTGYGWPNPALLEDGNWNNPFNSSPEKIDDLWHAAYNSRGTFISASTPQNVVAGLQNAIKNVQSRTGSASSVALNSGVINTNTRIYQARFVDSDWHGELQSISVNPTTGVPDVANAVDASANIQAANSRVFMTHDGTQGIVFDWTTGGTALTLAQQALLNTDAAGNPDALGMQRVAWLRGDSSLEQQNGGIFRTRTNGVLGDIINSAPVFVGAPDARYPDNWSLPGSAPENCPTCENYSTFKYNKASRTPMVYAGSNGGTVNGFNADFTATAVEKLAYVPSRVIENLSKLPDPNYAHRYFVDGSPTAVDAFFSSDTSWHTVLTGGLNRGGQGIYALDITDPSTFAATAASAQNTVLWEFTDADDPDLGYTYSQPAIVRMHNGQWAAVFGNGYNNRDNDGNQSTTGHAALYVVEIETGALIRKISTQYGSTGTPNGLSTPAITDTNGDFIADYIYAGDLEGNMWKFDVTDVDPANWDVAFYNAGVPEPLYVATDASNNRQPITVRPDIGRGPYGLNTMLFFGTGLYLQTSDLSDTSTQSFYGIIDSGTKFTGRGSLVAQTVDYEGVVNSIPVRVNSNNPPAAGSRGWYLDLPTTGERSVANPILRAGRIIFVTVIPDANVCNSGGESWLMELNAVDGTRLAVPPFDLNGDGLFTLLDYVKIDVDGDGIISKNEYFPPSGKGFTTLLPTPGILSSVNTEYKYTPTSSGSLEVTTENPGSNAIGRQSWGQLR